MKQNYIQIASFSLFLFLQLFLTNISGSHQNNTTQKPYLNILMQTQTKLKKSTDKNQSNSFTSIQTLNPSLHRNNDQTNQNSNKIVHELNNQGCQCSLCQKIIVNEMKIIKKVQIKDCQSEFSRKKQQHFSKFLLQYFYIDKLNRKVRIHLPQICIFEKGNPMYLLSKKKQALPLKLIKNKQKLNAFQIQNFFMDGYIFHNNLKENQTIMKNHKVKTLSKQYYKFDEYLKNQCIVLVKFINGTNQMMTPTQLSNLFKSKQKHVRGQIENITTMVCNSNYNQIRIRLNLQNIQKQQRQIKSSFSGLSSTFQNIPLLQRAKNQVKIVNQHIKPKDFMYVTQKQEKQFQDNLKLKNEKKYLEYIAMKMVLLHSLRTGILLNETLFKFMKDQKENYYLVDLQVYEKQLSTRLWGEFQNIIKNQKIQKSPQKMKKRPTSSPTKLMQNLKIQENEEAQINSQSQIFLNNKIKYFKQEDELIKPITVLNLHNENAIKNLTQFKDKDLDCLVNVSKPNASTNINRQNRQRGISMKQIQKKIYEKTKAPSMSFFKLEPIRRSKLQLIKQYKNGKQQKIEQKLKKCTTQKMQVDSNQVVQTAIYSRKKINTNIINRLQAKLL